jgi:hypothetical protein
MYSGGNEAEFIQNGLKGLRLIEELNPDTIREKMIAFIEKSVEVITEFVDREGTVDLIFPMNGGAMFMYLLKQRLPSEYVERINWVSAYRSNKNNKKIYEFFHSKGTFQGKPLIVDDMWDSGATSEFVSNGVSAILGTEMSDQIRNEYIEDERYTRSKGAIPIPVLVATTKDGKGCNSAIHSYKHFNGEDDWIAAAFALDCGKGSKETSRYERLSGVSYSVTNLKEYIETISEPYAKKYYEEILIATGEECYREHYIPMLKILEILDNEDMPIDLRNIAVQVELGLISA